MKIRHEIIRVKKETYKYIVNRAKEQNDIEELSEEQLYELFNTDCSGDVFALYGTEEMEHHNYDLGRYMLAKELLELLNK